MWSFSYGKLEHPCLKENNAHVQLHTGAKSIDAQKMITSMQDRVQVTRASMPKG